MYTKLKLEEEKTRLLNMLNYSVHHEMLGPLRANIDVAENLIRRCRNDPQYFDLANIIVISSKLLEFHANDLLDHRFLQNGLFTPQYTKGSASEAILEIAEVMKSTLTGKDI